MLGGLIPAPDAWLNRTRRRQDDVDPRSCEAKSCSHAFHSAAFDQRSGSGCVVEPAIAFDSQNLSLRVDINDRQDVARKCTLRSPWLDVAWSMLVPALLPTVRLQRVSPTGAPRPRRFPCPPEAF